MFESKNKNAIKITSAPQKEISLDNFPVHTMEKDIENYSNPEYNPALEARPVAAPQTLKPELSLSEKQKTSPFLSQNEGEKGKVQTNSISNSQTASADEVGSFHLGRVFSIFLGAFLLLAIAAGAYYFWMIKNSDSSQESTNNNPIETPIASEPEKKETSEKPTENLSFDKPNYLPLNLSSTDAEQINLKLKEYGQKIKEAQISQPAEFIVTGSDFSPIDFMTFAPKAGLNFSVETMSLLGPGFSLFIYNENEMTRANIVIDARNESELREKLKMSEKDFPNLFKFLLLESGYTSKTPSFSDGKYQEISSRYFNFDSPENLSLDYAFYNNKLIIGTSKKKLSGNFR